MTDTQVSGQLPVMLKDEKSCEGCPACLLVTRPSVYYVCTATGNHLHPLIGTGTAYAFLARARWCPVKIEKK